MGYTHYCHRVPELDEAQFLLAARDCEKVCNDSGVKIAFEYDQVDKAPEFSNDLICFNGIEDDGHETFYIERIFKTESLQEKDDNGKYFSFCKTDHKPYDLCVTACLIVFKYYFEDDVAISTDGENDDWLKARNLCQKVLGYGKDDLIELLL